VQNCTLGGSPFQRIDAPDEPENDQEHCRTIAALAPFFGCPFFGTRTGAGSSLFAKWGPSQSGDGR
jgi:hypothetical protein